MGRVLVDKSLHGSRRDYAGRIWISKLLLPFPGHYSSVKLYVTLTPYEALVRDFQNFTYFSWLIVHPRGALMFYVRGSYARTSH